MNTTASYWVSMPMRRARRRCVPLERPPGLSLRAHDNSTCLAVVGNHAGPAQLLFDPMAQSIRCRRLAMGDECRARRLLEPAKPSQDFIGIRVRRQHFEVLHLRRAPAHIGRES